MRIRIQDENKSIYLEVPDEDFTVMIDAEYEDRLSSAENKETVTRRSPQEIMDERFNRPEYNNWHKFDRHRGYSKAKPNDEGEELDTSEPLIKEVADARVFQKDEINRNYQYEYEDVCKWIRKALGKKQDWADMFIAVRIDGMSIREYASSIGADENNITKKLKRATKKLEQEYKNRQI